MTAKQRRARELVYCTNEATHSSGQSSRCCQEYKCTFWPGVNLAQALEEPGDLS